MSSGHRAARPGGFQPLTSKSRRQSQAHNGQAEYPNDLFAAPIIACRCCYAFKRVNGMLKYAPSIRLANREMNAQGSRRNQPAIVVCIGNRMLFGKKRKHGSELGKWGQVSVSFTYSIAYPIYREPRCYPKVERVTCDHPSEVSERNVLTKITTDCDESRQPSRSRSMSPRSGIFSVILCDSVFFSLFLRSVSRCRVSYSYSYSYS